MSTQYKFDPFSGAIVPVEQGPQGPQGVQGNQGPTGTVSAAGDGTAALPGITFASDTNTGIYRPGADQVAISTNGNGRLFVDASGNVGVGSSTFFVKPTNVNRVGYVGGGYSDTNIPGLGLALYRSGTGEHGHLFWSGQSTGGNNRNLGSIRMEQTVATTANGGGDLIFNTNPGTAEQPTERLRITSAGLVGVGTSAPSQLLSLSSYSNPFINIQHVGSSTGNKAGISFTMSSLSGASGALIEVERLGASAQSSLSFFTGSASGVNTRAVTIDQAQRVGIGVTSPGTNFHLNTNPSWATPTGGIPTNTQAWISSPVFTGLGIQGGSAGATYLLFADENDGDAGYISYSHSTDSMIFGVNANERARIDSSGRLLVGTSTSRAVASTTLNGTVQVENGNYIQYSAVQNTNDAGGPAIVFSKTRGTVAGAVTIVQSGDDLGTLFFVGADGTDLATSGATIKAQVDGTPGANDMPGRLVFSTTADGASSPTERLRITSDAYVRLASGTGGIQFNGDTAAANALDDYEEGTFTPTIAGTISPGTATYTTQVGKYTKTGNTVVVTCRLDWSLHTGTGSIYIAGLPFTSAGANAVGSILCGSLVFADGITSRILTGQTRVYPYALNSGAASTLVNIVAAGSLDVTCTYYVS